MNEQQPAARPVVRLRGLKRNFRQGDTVLIDAGTLAGRQVVTARAAHLSPGVLVQPVVAGPDAAAPQHPAGG